MDGISLFRKARQGLDECGKVFRRSVRAKIADSWHRSLKHGLMSTSSPVDAVVQQSQLRSLRKRHGKLLSFVSPELDLLYSQMAGTNFMVAFASADGVILDTIKDKQFLDSTAGKAVIDGSVWREELCGTNALGLAQSIDRPVAVTGPEHFFREHGEIFCAAAPIKDEHAQVVGLIDASSDLKVRQQHTLSLVQMAATNVENGLFVDSHKRRIILSFHPRREYLGTMNAGLLALCEDAGIVGACRKAKTMLNGFDLTAPLQFDEVFAMPYSKVFSQLRHGNAIQVYDWTGSSVFMSTAHYRRPDGSSRQMISATMGADEPVRAKPSAINRSEAAITPPIFQDSLIMKQLKSAGKAIKVGLPILIEGPSGAGKGELVREMHLRHAPAGDLITVACAHYADTDLKPLARACDPTRPVTLHFDELASLSLSAQTSLLKFLDDFLSARDGKTEQSPNILAFTTNQRIESLLKERILSDEFFNRICGLRIEVPKLELRADFDLLAKFLVKQISKEHVIADELLELLISKAWPGNVRQLRKSLQLLVSHAEGPVLGMNLAPHLGRLANEAIRPCRNCFGSALKEQRCVEIRRMLNDCNGNVSHAARQLGLSRTTVYSHLNG